ncbi:hypothetical protein GOV13_02525 [Candidatus Pacearchaeota archaeon]|nr:hypothetical protein [Candidatus Pacearchaeota archaeon]
MSTFESYPVDRVDKNLERYGFTREEKGDHDNLKYNGTEIKIPSLSGKVHDMEITKIAKKPDVQKVFRSKGIMEETGIVAQLTKPLPTEVVANWMLPIFSLALIVLVSARGGLLTGFAVSNISDPTSNLVIIVCLACVAGLAYWRFKGK